MSTANDATSKCQQRVWERDCFVSLSGKSPQRIPIDDFVFAVTQPLPATIVGKAADFIAQRPKHRDDHDP